MKNLIKHTIQRGLDKHFSNSDELLAGTCLSNMLNNAQLCILVYKDEVPSL